MENNIVQKLIGIFMVISTPVYSILGALSGLRQNWFQLGIYLSACAITVIICMGVLMSLRIDDYLMRLEKLISKNKNDKLSNE